MPREPVNTTIYVLALLGGVVGHLVGLAAGAGWLGGVFLAGGFLVFLFGAVRWLAEPAGQAA